MRAAVRCQDLNWKKSRGTVTKTGGEPEKGIAEL
ncbi:MAG: hypothetical protein K0R28_2794, partial [Paenibacillus sp.]|nr:hypothetical protein [Paenibacillus sp.]